MDKDKNPNIDALMAELKAIVDTEAQDMKGDAHREAEHIFTQIVKEFSKDSDVKDKQSILAVVSMCEDREKMIKDITENDAAYIRSDFVTKEEMINGVGKGAQCKIVANNMSESKFVEMLNDIESNILLCAWLDPVGLITRLKRNDQTLNVFVSAENIVFIRQLPNGEQVTNSWGADTNDRPKPSEFDDDFEYEFLRLSYKALAEPQMIKAKSQDAFEMMVSAIGDKIQQKMENLDDDDSE